MSRIKETINTYRPLVRKPITKRVPRFSRNFAKNTEINTKKISFDDGKWVEQAQGRIQWQDSYCPYQSLLIDM
jgi:hypothetical protein